MNRRRILVAAVAITAIPLFCAQAQDRQAFAFDSAWARPGTQGGMSAVYGVLRNLGDREAAVTGARCEGAAMTHLHRSTVENDMVRMAPVERLPVAAQGREEFRPGGLHIMLMGLARPLAAGDTVRCELSAGETVVVRFEAVVRAQ